MAENPNNRQYTNGEITVFWKPETCIHATICFMKLRSVFNPAKRPWVNMSGASTAEIIKVVDQCPTDALTWKWNKDLSADEKTQPLPESLTDEKVPTPVTEIMVIENGPALIKGKFKMIDGTGKLIETASQISLCRCGASKNKPFCDGTHHVTGFKG